MKQDLTTIDRVIRLLLAVAIVASYYTGLLSGIAVVILGIVAVAFMIITSVFA